MLRRALLMTVTGAVLSAHAAPSPYTATGSATFEYRVLFVNVYGTVAGVTSTVNLDLDDLAATTGTVTVPVERLSTGLSLRDFDARSDRALNTAKFPNATFRLEGLTGGRLFDNLTVNTTGTGTLTVKGVSRTISVPIKATRTGTQVKVNTQFKFNPHDYGVNYPNGSNSVAVNVTFTLQPTP